MTKSGSFKPGCLTLRKCQISINANKRFGLGVIALWACLLTASCSWRQNEDNLNALLWSATSAESEAIARQIFHHAKGQLETQLQQSEALGHHGSDRATDIPQSAALEQSGDFSKLLPAILVDLDETVLSNGRFHAELLSQGQAFTEEAWQAWVNQAASKPVPGALEYTQFAAEQGITVFYLTNRDVSLKQATWQNLRQAGFPVGWGEMQLLMRNAEPDWGWDKSSRRAFIADHYHILQIVGDSVADFISGTGDLSPIERSAVSQQYQQYWGERWFMIPNPVYGDWESAIVASGSMQKAITPRKAKYRFIRGGESQGVW